MIKIKACKPFRSEDVVNYCITAVVHNAGRKAEVVTELLFITGFYNIHQ